MPGRSPTRCACQVALLSLTASFCLSPGRGIAEESESQDYLIESVGTNEGLPANSITGLAQTPEGYLWAGTLFSGLLRYDGVRFVSFNPRNTPELPGNAVRRLMTDPSGRLWISGYDGSLTTWDRNGFSLAKKDAGGVEKLLWSQPGQVVLYRNDGLLLDGFRTANGWQWRLSGTATEPPPQQICADARGRIWILRGNRQLSIWENGSFRDLAPASLGGDIIRALAADDAGVIWVGTDHSLFQWKDDHFIDQTPAGAPMLPVRQIIPAGQSLWIESDGRLRRWAGGKWMTGIVDWRRNLSDGSVHFAQGDRDGGFWAANNKLGLIHTEADGSLRTFSTDDGLPGNSIASVCRDHDGNTWLGYFRGGMVRIRRRLIHTLGRSVGLGGELINSVCEDGTGAIWIGMAGTDVLCVKGGKCGRYSLSSPVTNPNTVVAVDGAGQVWACSHGGALVRLSDGRFVPVVNSGDLPHYVSLLLPARDGRLWVGAQKAIGVLTGDKFTEVYSTRDMIRRPAALAETTDGTIWAGTLDGYLMRWNGREFEVQEPPARGALGRLWSLCPTPDGGMWIGSSEGGLLRWKDGTFRRLSTANGLRSDSVVQVQTDLAGNLWLVTGAGIERIEAAALARFEDGGLTAPPVSQYGPGDGLLSTGGSIEFQPNCWCGRNGKLWFAMGGNVVNIQPEDVRINPVPPTVAIEELRVNQIHAWPDHIAQVSDASSGKPGPSQGTIPSVTIAPGQRDLEFRFTGLSFRAPQLIQFQYQLEGFESDWHSVGSERWARYYSVPPGSYLFRVKAANSDNIWDPNAAALALVLRPRFYETAWFQAGAFLAVGLILALSGWSAARRRMRRRMEVLESRRKIEQDRVRIARDMHDELGSKLARISYISEMAKQNQAPSGPAIAQIETIAETSRELLRSMDEIVWAVNPRNDNLEHLAAYLGQHAHEYFQNTSIECSVEIPSLLPNHSISAEARHHLYLSFRESLTNILKHSRASHAQVQMKVIGEEFQIRVNDDGKGIDSQNGQFDCFYSSEADGLRNMRERLEAVGGACDIESAPGKGTTISFSIPLKETK